MPRYYEDASEEECNRAGDDDDGASESVRSTTGRRSEPRIEHTYIVLFLLFFYYFCSCGIERLFQSMVSECAPILHSSGARESDATFTFLSLLPARGERRR